MIAPREPRFGESMAHVAQSLHLAEIGVFGLLSTVALFVWLERRWRWRWQQPSVAGTSAAGAPYRSSAPVVARLAGAPRLVLVLAFVSLGIAHVFAPLLALALAGYPFRGIDIPLLPGLGPVALNWCCAWLLLGRSPHAPRVVRSGASASMLGNVGLLGMALFHLYVIELRRRDGIEHSSWWSATAILVVLVVSCTAQAVLARAALRAHGTDFTGASVR